jgi:hypothetical protein
MNKNFFDFIGHAFIKMLKMVFKKYHRSVFGNKVTKELLKAQEAIYIINQGFQRCLKCLKV